MPKLCILKKDWNSLLSPTVLPQVTTARKAVTLLLSYLIFTKPLTEQHGTGLLLISMGIILKLLPDNKPHKRSVDQVPASRGGKASSGEDSSSQKEIEEEEEKRPLV